MFLVESEGVPYRGDRRGLPSSPALCCRDLVRVEPVSDLLQRCAGSKLLGDARPYPSGVLRGRPVLTARQRNAASASRVRSGMRSRSSWATAASTVRENSHRGCGVQPQVEDDQTPPLVAGEFGEHVERVPPKTIELAATNVACRLIFPSRSAAPAAWAERSHRTLRGPRPTRRPRCLHRGGVVVGRRRQGRCRPAPRSKLGRRRR